MQKVSHNEAAKSYIAFRKYDHCNVGTLLYICFLKYLKAIVKSALNWIISQTLS